MGYFVLRFDNQENSALEFDLNFKKMENVTIDIPYDKSIDDKVNV